VVWDAGIYERELTVAVDAAIEAGAAIRAFYEQSSAATYTKSDGSPVTDADLASDRIIRERLAAAFPDDAILTEEGTDDESRLTAERVWIVDPIDGTQQFINRTGEFDVLIALVIEQRPVVSVLYQPTEDRALVAAEGHGAWVQQHGSRIFVRFRPVTKQQRSRIATSTWLGAPASLPVLERVAARVNSPTPLVSRWGVTVRDLLPSVNRYDVMIGLDVTGKKSMAWEWDFVCSDLFVREAGGSFTDLWGRTHRYNKRHPRNCGGLLISVDASTHHRILAALAPEIGPVPPGT
jgi:3'-phosphoadenosine 5'-phosphosulfate (PAPS) 3'-phosphatase